jgi:hypothetical protein
VAAALLHGSTLLISWIGTTSCALPTTLLPMAVVNDASDNERESMGTIDLNQNGHVGVVEESSTISSAAVESESSD